MAVSGECQLADGRAIEVRVAGPDDVRTITRLYLELSPESFYRRFHAGQPKPALVARLASLGAGTVCLVAAPPALRHGAVVRPDVNTSPHVLRAHLAGATFA